MSKAHPPELKNIVKWWVFFTAALFCLLVKLNGGRHVQGILRGFDPFMNLVVDDSVEMGPGGQQNVIGMVVIRGNSIIMVEALERV
uniref:Small nuclear ribonucleoprotein G n=1 Tax=Cynoglossus semilaevis TaxID=244447 RepID=A0A3P8UYH2_CYNSE